ncbi:hypothetical protein HU200_048779 [Digitaria exilis]|uniref:F-box domain-containing protein n=1 Tax=Digitaria exilis TaxID=1010633 RepID=A0A835B0R2_9POAL|nr:hypothetical protein HU200_048779 [Digitaria exilis]
MEPAKAKRKKARRRRRGAEPEPDRLSALPDCLLHVIMSSLKARQVVQTCVLSRRWRDLWRTVPCLDVNLDEFRAKKTQAAPGGDHNAASNSNGVDNSDSDDEICGLDHENASSDDNADSSEDSSESDEGISASDPESSDSDSSDSCSSFSSSDDDDDSKYRYGGNKDKEWKDFEDFTVNLMHRCNISQLDSFRLHSRRFRAPRYGDRQVGGWLRRAMKYCTPDPAGQRKGLSPSPWHLKRLHLCFVALNNRFADHVTSVLRTLEDLELDDCRCEIQSVTSHSLKSLVLKNCRWFSLSEITSRTLKTLVIDGGSNTDDCLLVILTPAVAYLHLAVSVSGFDAGISLNDMPSLVKASIHLRDHAGSIFASHRLCGDQSKLICSVSNATSLELKGVGRKGSPNLEKLTLRHCKKKKGKTKLSKTTSSEFLGLNFMSENLKIEIVYKYGNGRQLIKLLCAYGNLSKKCIKLIKVN